MNIEFSLQFDTDSERKIRDAVTKTIEETCNALGIADGLSIKEVPIPKFNLTPIPTNTVTNDYLREYKAFVCNEVFVEENEFFQLQLTDEDELRRELVKRITEIRNQYPNLCKDQITQKLYEDTKSLSLYQTVCKADSNIPENMEIKESLLNQFVTKTLLKLLNPPSTVIFEDELSTVVLKSIDTDYRVPGSICHCLGVDTIYEKERNHPYGHITDKVINTYSLLLKEHFQSFKKEPIIILDTSFYTMLSQEFGASRKWWNDSYLTANKIIFIPIHLTNHWALAVVDVDKLKLSYYDSVQTNESTVKLRCSPIVEWCLMFSKVLKMDRIMGLPKQKNSYDCGIYMLMFIELLLNHLPIQASEFHQYNVNSFRVKVRQSILKGKYYDNTIFDPNAILDVNNKQ